MEIHDIQYSSLEKLLENISNTKVSSKKLFCRIYHDIAILMNTCTEDCPSSLTAEIEDIQNSYEKVYWRNYYMHLFSFIYFDFTYEQFSRAELAFRENVEEEEIGDIEVMTNELKEYQLLVESHNTNLKKSEKEYKNDNLLFRQHFIILASYKGFIDAYETYSTLCASDSNFNELLNIQLLEQRLRILKHETIRDNATIMMYLTYSQNPAKSNTSRIRNYQAPAYKQQVVAEEQANYWAKEVVSRFYQLKHYNPKLNVEHFLESKEARGISRRTFFNYKKNYDKKIGKGKWKKNTEEKAYDKYILELEKNPKLEINRELCKKLKVGQKALREQIEKENKRT